MNRCSQVRVRIVASLIVSLTVLIFAGCGDDGPAPDPISQLAIAVEPTNVVAGSAISPAIEVTIQTASGATATGATDTVTIQSTPIQEVGRSPARSAWMP